MFVWVSETKLTEFLVITLKFCMPRLDTYAELVKEQATMLIVMLVAHESNIAVKTCGDLSNCLLDTIGELLCSDIQCLPVRINCIWIFANLCAEAGSFFKHAVLERTNLM